MKDEKRQAKIDFPLRTLSFHVLPGVDDMKGYVATLILLLGMTKTVLSLHLSYSVFSPEPLVCCQERFGIRR